eukprot:3759934-Alexandrium_andersonii.AAC.1
MARHGKPLQAIASHCKPMHASACQRMPAHAIACHCKPLKAIACFLHVQVSASPFVARSSPASACSGHRHYGPNSPPASLVRPSQWLAVPRSSHAPEGLQEAQPEGHKGNQAACRGRLRH